MSAFDRKRKRLRRLADYALYRIRNDADEIARGDLSALAFALSVLDEVHERPDAAEIIAAAGLRRYHFNPENLGLARAGLITPRRLRDLGGSLAHQGNPDAAAVARLLADHLAVHEAEREAPAA